MLLQYMKCPSMKFLVCKCLNNLLTLLVFTAHFNKCLLKLSSYTFILTICIQIIHFAVQCLKINPYYIVNILLTLYKSQTREETPGRHEPLLCRHRASQICQAERASTKQIKPQLCRLCLIYAVNEPPPYSAAFFKSWFL